MTPTAPFLALAGLAAMMAAPSAASDRQEEQRLRLEDQRRDLSAQIGDPEVMQDQGRATITRLSVERGWKDCAENEAAALAQASDRAAELLAEEALARCGDWEKLLRLALAKGAYPYLAGPTSADDMVTLAKLESRDNAIARISMWRAGSFMSAPIEAGDVSQPEPASSTPPVAATAPAPTPQPPAESSEAAPATEDEQTIVVTASRRWGCRARLADRTLTDEQLEANAKIWAANATPLRVVRPPGADYNCLAKIVWSLSKHGVTLFHFVDPSEAR
jgi:hypothetical protein